MTTKDNSMPAPMTFARFQALLDAYGARSEHWPEAERDAARSFVIDNVPARALLDAAAELDAMLDLVPPDRPTSDLAQRIAAHGTIRRPSRGRTRVVRRWLAAAALPLAAAAALVLWLVPQNEVVPVAAPQYAVEDLGSYTTPTDLLLEPPGFDLAHTLPEIGCSDNGLGCPDMPVLDNSDSSLHVDGGTSV